MCSKLCLTSCLFWLAACQTPSESSVTRTSGLEIQALPAEDIQITDGQTVYVPAYSHVYYLTSERPYPLAITLSVRNTDPDHSITLTDVSYSDSDGKPIERYVTEPLNVGPMASTEFFVGQSDMRGGVGANFLVTWESDSDVYEPVVEAAMVGTVGTQGVTFLSQGRVYQNRK